MLRDSLITLLTARVASLPFRLFGRRPFQPPKQAVILKPCCISQVMLATPLLAALSEAYPQARFDWAVCGWARPAVATNPRLTELIDTGRVGLPGSSWADVQELIGRLRGARYDTCFIPSRSSLLSYIAWRAGIPQRIGLNMQGRGFAHTLAVRPPKGEVHEAFIYLSLARAIGIDSAPGMEFYPADADRSSVTRRLVEEVEWQGEGPLVILHPGGGDNPLSSEEHKRWPVERFALLAGRLAREEGTHILVVGSEEEVSLAESIVGLMPERAFNLAGQMTLSELGALCEVASLYVGNDAGPTHIAAAVACPTLALFGPSDPDVSGPYTPNGRVVTLRPEIVSQPFTWDYGPSPDQAFAAARSLLAGEL